MITHPQGTEIRAPRKVVSGGFRRDRGITFIELVVLVIIVSIAASLAARNFSRLKEGQDQRAFAADLRSEVARAKVEAIMKGTTVSLTYDPTQGAVTINEITVDPNADPSQATPVNQISSQTMTPIHTLQVPPTVKIDGFTEGTVSGGTGQWQIQFFPDGRSEGGGIQVNFGNAVQSLVVDTHGDGSYVSGPIPDLTNDVWQAGNLDAKT